MWVTRLFTGGDDESHFEDLDIPTRAEGDIGSLSSPQSVTSLIFRETPATYDLSWHNAPARQYVVMLEGWVEVEVGDGTCRRFGPGDILLAEDTTGRGHRSRAIGANPRRSLFITLD